MEGQLDNLAIDFDGVVHTFDKVGMMAHMETL